MAVEAIKSCVVAIAGVGRIALDALAVVPAGYGGIETLSGTVPSDALFFIYFSLEIKRDAVHS